MSKYELTAEELADKADRLEESGDLNEALLYWQLAVNRELDPIMLCRLGNVAMELGNLTEAERAFISAIELAPNLTNAHNLLGMLYLEQNDIDAAYACFSRSAEIKESPRTLTFLGSVQSELGMVEIARQSFTKAIILDSNYEEAHYNLGLTFRYDHPAEAVISFSKALEINPRYAIAHRELGWTLLRLRQYLGAESHLRKSIEIDDSDGWAYVYLGNLLWMEREIDVAEDMFKKAIEVWPEDSLTHWCIAIFYEYNGRKNEADFFYEKALHLDPDDPEANLRFGLFLKELGQNAKAKIHLERVLISDPKNGYAKAVLEEIELSSVTDDSSHLM